MAFLTAIWTRPASRRCARAHLDRIRRLGPPSTAEQDGRYVVWAPLKAVLDAEPRRAVTILTTQAGLTWTPDGFGASWRKAARKAGINGLTFHDLRGTAVPRVALAVCTVPEIATITGHSIRDVQSILDSNHFSSRRSARRKWNPQARAVRKPRATH